MRAARVGPEPARAQLSSVHRPGVAPQVLECDEDTYVDTLRSLAQEAAGDEGLCAFVCSTRDAAHWLSRQLGDAVRLLGEKDALPAKGVVALDLALAKGLEFDHVIVADAQEAAYPASDLSRRRLYTAISRATHKVTICSRSPVATLLADALATL